MKKNTGFLSSLQKSTKVTLLSCISFIALTLLILIFFILFPITPSERIMASIGRENMFNNNPQNVTPAAVTSAVTTAEAADTDIFGDETGTRTTKTYKIVITTGSGFLWNGRIPEGISDTKTTVVIYDDPQYPTPDPGYSYPLYTQPSAEPEPEVTDIATSADPNYPVDPAVTDITPVVTDTPAPVDPIVTDIPPVVTDAPAPVDPVVPDPPQTQPPIIIDPQPPVDNPGWVDPNAGTENGDDVSEW